MELVFEQEYPAVVKFHKIKELGIEKISVTGSPSDIDKAVKIIEESKVYSYLHIVTDAWLVGRDDGVWGEEGAIFGIEKYQLWLLGKR